MSDHGKFYLVEGINPVPWTAPQSSGFGKNQVWYKSEELRAYQEAIGEEFVSQNPNFDPLEPDMPIALEFMFWRRLDAYEIEDGKKSRLHRADATNLQKATEDALQGVLFPNDREVSYISSRIVSQDEATEPAIMIKASYHHMSHDAAISMRRDMIARRQVSNESQPDQQETRIKKWDVGGTF